MPRSSKAAAAPARRKSRARASVAEALVPFAHLMEPAPAASAPSARKARRAEEEDQDRDDRDDRDDDVSGENEDEDEKEGKGARSRRASDDDDDDTREGADDDTDGDEDDEEERDRARSRRTAADEDDEEEQDERDERDPKARSARARERARCARILGSKAAAGRAAAAANLACNTTMSAKAAIRLLGTLPKQQAAAPGLGARMAELGARPSASDAPTPTRREANAASWDRAMQRAGIRRG